MTRYAKISFGLIGIFSIAGMAIAAPKHTKASRFGAEETSAVQYFRVGEIVIDDARILDLTGSYTVEGLGGAAVSLDVVQDSRGKLTGSISMTRDGLTSVTLPASGSLAVQRNQPLKFDFSGNSKGGKRGNGRGKSGVSVRGVLDETTFTVTVSIKGSGQSISFTGTLVPENPLRGAVVSDAAATSGTKGGLMSSRTVTLPWATVNVRAMERLEDLRTRFYATSGVEARGKKGARAIGRTGIVEIDIKGQGTATGEFVVQQNKVRLGYGHLESAAETSVSQSLF